MNEEEKPSLKDMDLLLEVFFGFFDKNGDGVISICELKQTMEDMGEKPRSGHECNCGLFTYWGKNHGILVRTLGWAWFAWAAQELSVHRMGAYCDIKKLKSTHINPALASHAEPKADIGL